MTDSSGRLRRIGMMMERLASVSGNFPIFAMAIGAHVLKAFGIILDAIGAPYDGSVARMSRVENAAELVAALLQVSVSLIQQQTWDGVGLSL